MPLRSLEEQIDPRHTALLIVDVQNDFVHPDGLHGQATLKGETDSYRPGRGHLWEAYPLIPRALKNLEKLLEAARRVDVLIVFVKAAYDPKYISPAQRVLMEKQGTYGKLCQSGTWGSDHYGELRPLDSRRELVVVKHRWSGFWGTDLDLALRSNGIQTLVMTGTSTGGCVEATSRDGFFNDYYIVTVEDCCADRAQERQDASMQITEWSLGLVASMADVTSIWSQAGPTLVTDVITESSYSAGRRAQ